MLTLIATLLINRFGVAEDLARGLAKLVIFILISFVVIGVVVWGHSCYRASQIQQTRDELNVIRGETTNANFESKVAEQDVNKAKGEVNEKQIEAKRVLDELDEIREKDSSLESPDGKKALERYCGIYDDPHLCGGK